MTFCPPPPPPRDFEILGVGGKKSPDSSPPLRILSREPGGPPSASAGKFNFLLFPNFSTPSLRFVSRLRRAEKEEGETAPPPFYTHGGKEGGKGGTGKDPNFGK